MKNSTGLKEKKRYRNFLLAGALLCVLFLFSGTASPPEQPEGEIFEELNENIDELLEALDTEELEAYFDSLSRAEGGSLKEKIKELVTGDSGLDYTSLGQAILDFVLEEAYVLLPAFSVILAIALLCGIMNSAKSGFLSSTISGIIELIGYISVGAVVLACLISVLGEGFAAIAQMQRQMELVFPVLLTLMAASGGAVSVAVYRPAVAFMSGGICALFSSVILPVAVVVIVLGFLGNLSEEVRTEKIGDFFKSLSKWLIGLSLGLFSLFLTVQGISSAQYDGLSLRTAKYVISGSVPIVGGFLSGSAELIAAGSALIKNALGMVAIFLLAGALLKPLLLLILFQLFLRIAAAATEPVGGKIPAFLSRVAGDAGYFIAALLGIGFLYFLTLLLLICSSGVIF